MFRRDVEERSVMDLVGCADAMRMGREGTGRLHLADCDGLGEYPCGFKNRSIAVGK